MTQRAAQLHARTHSVSQLGNVVNAMRGIAATRAQQSRHQMESVQAYADTVARAISQVLALLPVLPDEAGPRTDGRRAVLLLCAEQGFAGAFSERVLECLGRPSGAELLLLVGSRGLRLAHAKGLAPAWTAPMVSQLVHAGALADRISAELYRHLQAGRVRCVEVIYARPLSASGFEVIRRTLLPLDYARFGAQGGAVAPLMNLSPQVLLERLAAEYLFAQLNEAIVHSYAAENTARLQTMTAARENIASRLETLTSEERLARQEEITAEIVELAAGTEALRSGT
jgi:F-type H+-transporting ATPase subunit gamma